MKKEEVIVEKLRNNLISDFNTKRIVFSSEIGFVN